MTDENNPPKEKMSPRKLHKCRICHKTFRHKCSLKRHECEAHGQGPYATYGCQHCHYIAKCRGDLKKHMACRHPAFVNRSPPTRRKRRQRFATKLNSDYESSLIAEAIKHALRKQKKPVISSSDSSPAQSLTNSIFTPEATPPRQEMAIPATVTQFDTTPPETSVPLNPDAYVYVPIIEPVTPTITTVEETNLGAVVTITSTSDVISITPRRETPCDPEGFDHENTAVDNSISSGPLVIPDYDNYLDNNPDFSTDNISLQDLFRGSRRMGGHTPNLSVSSSDAETMGADSPINILNDTCETVEYPAEQEEYIVIDDVEDTEPQHMESDDSDTPLDNVTEERRRNIPMILPRDTPTSPESIPNDFSYSPQSDHYYEYSPHQPRSGRSMHITADIDCRMQ